MNQHITPRKLFFPGFELPEYEREAIQWLRDHEPEDGYQVGFSGGKDSIVTLDLVRRSGVKHTAHYAMCGGLDEPSVLRFVRQNYPDVEFKRPKFSFFKGIEKNGLPSPMMRWCCQTFKESHGTDCVVGVRKEESVRRAKRQRIDQMTKKKKIYKPIFEWPEWAVWEYIDKHHLPYPALYDNGANRIGCVICVMRFNYSQASIRRINENMAAYPLQWKATEKAARKFYTGHFKHKDKYPTFSHFWRLWLCGFRIKLNLIDLSRFDCLPFNGKANYKAE